MIRFCLIGPTYPFRGGIAHYTTLLAKHLSEEHDSLLISFRRQYPKWLFPGRDDHDPSKRPLQTAAEYLLDPLNPLTWRKTLHRIRQWRPDVVIVPWWVPFWTPAWAVIGRGVKRLSNCPKLIYICHNVLPHEQSVVGRRLYPIALRIALARGDGFIVHSSPDRYLLLQLMPGAKVEVTPHPTYEALGTCSASQIGAELPRDRPLLLFCGFVRPYKGLDVLLDALPKVLSRRPVHLVIAGEFWQGRTAQYSAQIRRLDLGASVTVIDRYLPDEELAALLAMANVVVLPYLSATQSGMVQAAFGQGTPVITTNVGGLPEAVVDGGTGLIVEPNDPGSLAAAIERYFSEKLEGEFAANILRERDRFSWGCLAKKLELLAQ